MTPPRYRSNPANRDPEVIAHARRVIALPKLWIGGDAILWNPPGPCKPSWWFTAQVEVLNSDLDDNVTVRGFFRPTTVPGAQDKLSFTLEHRGHRIVGIDTQAGSHTNFGGRTMPRYQPVVPSPQLHIPADDVVYGYAEPLPEQTPSDHWQTFLEQSNIQEAPPYSPPQGLNRDLFLL